MLEARTDLLTKVYMLALCLDPIFFFSVLVMNSAPAVLVESGGLRFLAVSVVRLAMYCGESAVFLPETAAFQKLV